MKPIIKLASLVTPDGKVVTLTRRDTVFSLCVDRQELMSSRAHESELELARLGCAGISNHSNPTVLIGGLGLGYTLRETLDMLRPGAHVVVAELIPEVVEWNRTIVGELAGHPLRDKRVVVKICDVVDMLRNSPHAFDVILLDIDNGPAAITADGNARLYSPQGVRACRAALRPGGCLAVWSAAIDPEFELLLQAEQFQFKRCLVPVYKGAKSRTRCVMVATIRPPANPLP